MSCGGTHIYSTRSGSRDHTDLMCDLRGGSEAIVVHTLKKTVSDT